MLRNCTRGDRAVYLHRAGQGAMGHRWCLKGYDRASKKYSEKQEGTVLGSETISLVSCQVTYKPPQADSPESQNYVCDLQSCHGAVVLLRYLRCPKMALQFSLGFLYDKALFRLPPIG